MWWTREEFCKHAEEWDLSVEPGVLAFSDWLLEQNQPRWANLIRWVNASQGKKDFPLPDEWVQIIKDGRDSKDLFVFYRKWRDWAIDKKLPIIKE